jgi:hypothetical protein
LAASRAHLFWSTLGSITGSLLAGFVLIPNIGVGRVLIGVGVLLVLVGLVPLLVLARSAARVYGVAAGAAALALVRRSSSPSRWPVRRRRFIAPTASTS